ncbi:hypothetical protein GGR56DRAFT_530188 [Xylariaceae sp. FL0804]|nr:hypothetical protein GGR56DRAFT_530188 [Xylariaceae sp. FL0804]
MQTSDHAVSSRLWDDLAKDGVPTHYPEATPLCLPPCDDCPDCSKSFFTEAEQGIDRFRYTAIISNAEAEKVISGYKTKITEDWAFLVEQCKARGDRIITRWKKRIQPKRAAALLQAEPDICEEQYGVPRFNYTDCPWQTARTPKIRKMFLLPWLNVAMLSQNPTMLFALLHSRTHFSPQEWAAYDSKQITIGWVYGLFDVEYNISSVIMYGAQYGQLTPWDADQMHQADTLGFPRARLVFEAQSTLLQLLRRLVETLLGEDPPVSSAKWNGMIAKGFRKVDDKATWSHFVYQPFSSPPRLDLNELLSQAKLRVDALGDHLWLLQTEPAYLHQFIRTTKQLSIAQVVSNTHLYSLVAGEIMGDYIHHKFWFELYDELQLAAELSRRFRDSIHPGSSLPKKYNDVIGSLELLLVNAIHRCSKHLHVIVACRPGFSRYYKIQRTGRGVIMEGNNRARDGFFKADPLYWCLQQLQGPADDERRFDYAMLFDFLDEHLAKSSKEERSRLDSVLYEKLSDYAVIIDMLTTIRLSRPQNRNRTADFAIVTDDRRAWRAVKNSSNMPTGIVDNGEIAVLRALRVFHQTPLPSGGKNENWLARFNAAHESSQAFWREMYGETVTLFKKTSFSPGDVRISLEPLEMWKSPEYLQLIKSRNQDVLSKLKKPKPSTDFDVFLPLPHSIGERPSFTPAEVKEKIKTRNLAVSPSPAQPRNDEDGKPDGTSASTLKPAVRVSRKSLTVFRSMFPRTADERGRTTDWEAFVGAMIEAGFAVRNGGGSMVNFESDGDGGGGRIVFHRPHPVAKIDPVMFQAMGRRLNRWFGWSEATFALKDQ